MTDLSLRLLEKTYGGSDKEKECTDRETTQSEREGFQMPTGESQESSDAGFEECSSRADWADPEDVSPPGPRTGASRTTRTQSHSH